jgi:hypothetical protein
MLTAFLMRPQSRDWLVLAIGSIGSFGSFGSFAKFYLVFKREMEKAVTLFALATTSILCCPKLTTSIPVT